MSLSRAWRHELFRASAAALLAPGAVVAALIVLAISGGFSALGSLTQAFAGPSIQSFATTSHAPAGGSDRGRHPSAAPSALTAPTPASVSAGATRSSRGGASATGAPAPGSTGPGSPSPRQGAGSGGGSAGHATPGGPGSPGTPGSPGIPGSPPAPPPQPPTVIDKVVSLGTSVTQRVPGPVGTVATQTLQSVGHTLNGILSPRARG